MYKITVKGKNYYVEKSKRKNKKYDVYNEDCEYITSFGQLPYQHYKDLIGEYKHLDHKDKERRERYLARAKGIGNVNNPNSANFWSINFLW